MGINLTTPTLNESLLVIDWDCGGDDGLAYVLYGVARVLRGQQARLQAVRDRKEHVEGGDTDDHPPDASEAEGGRGRRHEEEEGGGAA